MLTRVRRFLESGRECAPTIGWIRFFEERAFKRLGIKQLSIKTKGLRHRVVCRVCTSDIFEYERLLGQNQVPLELPIRPEFIVDAGANAGFSVLRFEKQFPGAKIIAIEPEKSNILQFKKNCAMYPNIALEEKALWATNSRLRIRSLDVGLNAFQVQEDESGDVQALSMNEVMIRHHLPRIDLLKMDIEGSEKVVFSHASAKNWLQFVRMILVETHDSIEEGCTDAVERALEAKFDFKGHIDEYKFYVLRRLD
jgi:FkbM family methyltransferase